MLCEICKKFDIKYENFEEKKQNSGTVLFGCIKGRITVRVRQFFSCVKKPQDKSVKRPSKEMVSDSKNLHNS